MSESGRSSALAESLPAQSVAEAIQHFALTTPDNVFLIAPATGREITWRALAEALPPVAALAESMQVPVGAPLAYMLENGWAAVQLLLGGLACGRVLLPLNPLAGDAQISYILQQSGSRAIVTEDKYYRRLCDITEKETAIQVTVVSNSDGICDGTPAAAAPLPAADDRALLMYTSGTTGLPKGVVHTHGSLFAGGENVALAHQLTAADRALCVLPLYHINALCVTVVAPLITGGGVVMPSRFQTGKFWGWINAHECTWFSVVPTLLSYLLQADETPPVAPRLRFGRSASAPLPPLVHKTFEERFQVPMIETMGLTETAAQILSNPLPPAVRKIGSPGLAYGNEVIVLDAVSGAECPDGEIGELAVRGKNVMREYNDNPEETAQAFTDAGWLRTGDLGYRDAEGYFFITGRRKELIIKGGENIAPREIDEALIQLPQVIEAAAFACPCERYGQRIEACVTVTEDSTISETDILLHCEKVIGKFKSPDRVYFMEKLPRGPSGKVQRLKLADIIAAKS